MSNHDFEMFENSFSFLLSAEAPKEERPELQKKTYKWNTKEEAKLAFKELLKEKVSPAHAEVIREKATAVAKEAKHPGLTFKSSKTCKH